MGLFDPQLQDVRRFIEEKEESGDIREFRTDSLREWPLGTSLILEDDTAVELGNPRLASLSFLIWSDDNGVEDGRISLVGPDVGELTEGSVPFAQVLMVSGEFSDEYECFRNVREAVYDTKVQGFSIRTMPSRQSIWCRVSKEAFGNGFSLSDLGAALVRSLRSVDFVAGAEALFVTNRGDVKRLEEPATGARRTVDALIKMYEEKNFDCETCEYRDVCDSVMDLKKIRKRLTEAKAEGE